MRQHLLNTGDRLLVEASPRDTIWGIGLRADDPDTAAPTTWLGKNLLGSALQQVRTLRRETALSPSPGRCAARLLQNESIRRYVPITMRPWVMIACHSNALCHLGATRTLALS